MTAQKPIPENKSSEALLNYFLKSGEDLKKVIDFLDGLDGRWRKNPPRLFEELLRIEKEIKPKEKKKRERGKPLRKRKVDYPFMIKKG